MSDPITIIGELQELTTRLDAASKELYKIQVEFDEVQERRDDIFNDLLVALLDEYETSEKRLPGEDVRNALVTKTMREQEPILFGQHRRLRDELARKHSFAKSIERAISSYQSQLSYLRVEASAIQ